MQQHGSKYFALGAPLTPTPDPGVKSSKFNFSKTWSDCIPNKIESQMAKHGSIYFARRPPPTPTDPGGGVKMSKLTFSKHGHVAYQLKWNHKCSVMVANISPADPQGPGGQRLKLNFFRTLSCCISKGIANAATW